MSPDAERVPTRARPARRWCHATAMLEDFAILTWAVDAERVASLLPSGFEPDLHGDDAMVSMVAFRDRRFRFRAAPFAPVTCGQVNYRTYVRRGEQRGVWFFGTTLDSAFVQLPRRAWKMPWHRGRMALDASWDDEHCLEWRATVIGGWGRADVTLSGTGNRLPVPDGFTGDGRTILLDPVEGWYARRDGSGVGRYTVWHQPLDLEEAVVTDAHCQVFTELGLIDAGAAPWSAGVQRRTHFDVHTPPTRA